MDKEKNYLSLIKFLIKEGEKFHKIEKYILNVPEKYYYMIVKEIYNPKLEINSVKLS